MRTGTVQVGGGTLETGWWGPGPAEAPTLVLLHEGLGCVALWRDVPERLAAATGWGVFAYSRFGYGKSDPTLLPRPMTYMYHEAQVVLPEVLRAAGIEQAALLGHSDGGSIAAIYAGSFGDPSADVAHCTAISARNAVIRARNPVIPARNPVIPGLDPGIATYAGAVGDPRVKPGDDERRGPEGRPAPHLPDADLPGPDLLGIVTIAAHFVVEDLNIASIRRIKREYENGTLRQRLARYHRHVDVAFRGWNDAWLDPRFRDFDITGLLPHIQVPVLGLQGAADPYGTDRQIDILKANVRAPIATQLIAGAQHSPHLEAKDATLAAITSFIATLPRGS
jgi:pimeloyl-ACP methyl ester carboxylesterase